MDSVYNAHKYKHRHANTYTTQSKGKPMAAMYSYCAAQQTSTETIQALHTWGRISNPQEDYTQPHTYPQTCKYTKTTLQRTNLKHFLLMRFVVILCSNWGHTLSNSNGILQQEHKTQNSNGWPNCSQLIQQMPYTRKFWQDQYLFLPKIDSSTPGSGQNIGKGLTSCNPFC